MRWPFGPPHLTLKPSKKNQKQKNTKKKKKERKSKKTQKYQKRAFQLSVKIFFFFWWVSKNCLFHNLAQKLPQNTIKIGVSAYFFENKLCVTKRPFLDKKKPKFINFSYHFFLWPFLSLSTTNNAKICWNLYYYSVLANLKKENFQILNLKQRNLKNPIFAPIFLKKAIFT